MPIVLILFHFLFRGVASTGMSTNHILLLAQPTKSGDSFFGFSHIFLPATEVSPPAIIVSAPRKREDGVATFEPGVVWKCFLGTMRQNETCHKMIFPEPNVTTGDPCSRKRCEWNDGSWLGMTLGTDGNERLLVCSPKWQRSLRAGNPRLNGLCYLMQQNTTGKRLFPLSQPANQVVDKFPVHSWGQAGFSASLVKDEILLGAPGVNAWNGTVIRYVGDTFAPDMEQDFTILDTTILQLFYNMEYLGYSVTTGRYFEDGMQWYVAGAPRGSSLRGLIIIFQFPTNVDETWFPEILIEGDSFGTYFGSVLTSGDFNGDGADDLIVGAPFRSRGNVKDSPDSSVLSDEGCIFVYTSKGRQRSFGKPEVICGSRSPGARFGSTVAHIGDVNGDSFKDFAVGAPYEDNEGAVYIYYGKANLGLGRISAPTQFAQHIRPGRDVDLTLKGFGSSIFGNVDLDDNGTPDVGIGAFISEALVIFRTRRTVHLENEIRLVVNGSFVEELEEGVDEFVLRTCTRIGRPNGINTTRSLEKSLGLEVDVEVTFDPSGSRYKIVEPILKDVASSARIIQNGTGVHFRIVLNAEMPICTEWTIQNFQENGKPAIPEQSEVNVHWKVTYANEVHLSPGIRKYVLDGEKLRISGENFDSFCSLCPNEASSTGVVSYPFLTRTCEETSECQPAFDLDFYFVDQNGRIENNKSFLLTSKKLELILKISNGGQSAGNPEINLSWTPDWLLFSNYEPFCTFNVSKKAFQCTVGTVDKGKSEIFRVTLESFYARSKTTLLRVSAFLRFSKNYISRTHFQKDQNQSEVKKEVEIALSSQANVKHFSGSANRIFINGNHSRTEFQQTFKMGLLGESGVEVSYNFWFPATFKTNSIIRLFHPIGGGCKIKKPETNTQRFQSQGKESNTILTLTCSTPQVSCLYVSCPARPIDPSVPEGFNFRFSIDLLTTRTLMREMKSSSVEIQSKAELTMFEDTVHEAYASTVFEDPTISVPAPPKIASNRVALSTYILGILGGILALLLVCLILLRCGFFRRETKAQIRELQKRTHVWTYSPVYEGANPEVKIIGTQEIINAPATFTTFKGGKIPKKSKGKVKVIHDAGQD